tara:strand:- start:44 stop:205 length:162 start_codon:yes stop_codon:yes gene_type:complete
MESTLLNAQLYSDFAFMAYTLGVIGTSFCILLRGNMEMIKADQAMQQNIATEN